MALTDKLTAIGDAVRQKSGTTEKMTLDQMATAVNNLEINSAPNVEEISINKNGTYTPNEGVDGFNKVIVNVPVDLGDLPTDLLHLTGDQSYKFYGNNWNSFLNKYGNQITTENITNISFMFQDNTQLQNIPFTLNIIKTTTCSFQRTFYEASSLKHLPIISDCRVSTIDDMCSQCYNLKEININFSNWDLSSLVNNQYGYGYEGGWHKNCYSLRQIPMSYYDKVSTTKTIGNKTSSAMSVYYRLAYCCYNVDEIIDMPVIALDTYSSNQFDSAFDNTYRLKNFTFKVKQDSTPYNVKTWKTAIIDLSTAGYDLLSGTYYKRNIHLYNSGITIDKCIYDDATYQALKNDPDNYVCGYSSEKPYYYSRYDKASAIRTINSLPDVSGFTNRTNTIKFKGEAGLKTDNGAINTMTTEEIAVATAKGWTVSFV